MSNVFSWFILLLLRIRRCRCWHSISIKYKYIIFIYLFNRKTNNLFVSYLILIKINSMICIRKLFPDKWWTELSRFVLIKILHQSWLSLTFIFVIDWHLLVESSTFNREVHYIWITITECVCFNTWPSEKLFWNFYFHSLLTSSKALVY